VLRQIAADALHTDVDNITVEMGDSTLPTASVAGGSAGTTSWGWAVTNAARDLRQQLGRADGIPPNGLSAEADTSDLVADREVRPRHAFGAHFVEVHVDADTNEVRVARALGVFAAGRIMNPRLARSQFIGAMSMGLSMGLMEEGVLDPSFAEWVNHDLAEYHVVTNADIRDVDAIWLDEFDDDLNPMGGKGIGEIGIVGIAAAVANAGGVRDGVRIRDLPLRLDRLF
jgi:xanthine dehydrogenase YagR molybdenum-binding subunit